jgi:hypothetical protein
METRPITRVAALALTAAVLLPAFAHAAPDCAGGTIRRLRLAPDRVRFEGTITRPGLTHDALVADPEGFVLTLVDANDPSTVFYSLTLPATRFVRKGTTTRYDKQGVLKGSLILQNAGGQADTVKITLRAQEVEVAGTDAAHEVRAVIGTAGGCARTCVAQCAPRETALACGRSRTYEPFADEGFGVLERRGSRRSGLCGLEVDRTPGCDFLIEERCLLPYPSSAFLVPDATTPTGQRLAYGPTALPKNSGGKHIDPTDWNTLDGFSPGPLVVALFPDNGAPVDTTASGLAFHTSYPLSLATGSPSVLLDAASGERVVHFVELDANTTDVTRRALLMRPGRRLDDASRYIVAYRNLVDTNGDPIRPRLAFRALRDVVAADEIAAACGTACAATIAPRLANLQDVFHRLAAAGIDPAELVLAWDFTTASTQALTGWMRSIRDQAFALGTPTFSVTNVNDNGGAGFNANIHMRIEGFFQAPLFMTADAPASRLNLVNGVPTQNGFANVPYVVDVPRIAVNVGGAPRPGRPTLWGHGLVGSRTQVGSLSLLAQTFDFLIGGVDMQGMSSADVGPAIVPATADASNFHFIPERLHQGFLNHLLLGRLMLDPVNGFNSHPAFQRAGVGLIDTTEVYYSGGSQGGIFGLAIMAIAEDFKRGFLAVPGANYSTLLHRSIDFNPYLALFRAAYPDRLDEELILGLIQQLWDRAEPQSYLPHILPGTLSNPPVPHEILIHMATYDSEVANVGTEIAVRSLGIPQLLPAARSYFQIPERAAPFDGSVFVEVDPMRGFSRCNVPPPGNPSPGAMCSTDADCPGPGDPPGRTRCDSGIPPLNNTAPPFNNGAHGSTGSPPMGQQIDQFLRPNGNVQQFCAGPCDPS